MLKRTLWKALLAAGSVGVLAAAMTSCAAVHAASDHVVEGGAAVGGGFLSMLFGVTGPLGIAIAGLCGWLGGLLFTPRCSVTPGTPAGFPWGILVLGVAVALVFRAWGHTPALLRDAWALIKTAARALLGKLQRPNDVP